MRLVLKMALLLAGLALPMQSSTLFAAEYTAKSPLRLTMTSTFMDVHPAISKGLIVWAENIKKETQDRVIIEFYNPNTLCPEGEIYDSVKNGLVSIGSQNVTRVRGKFPLSRIMDLPFIHTSSESGSVSKWRLYEAFPEIQKEFSDTHVLTFWSSALDQVHSAKKPFDSLENLKGAQISGMGGGHMELLKALGASGVQISPNELYLALQRGQVDGVVCPLAYMRSTKVYEAAKTSYIVNMNSNGFYLVMTKSIWDSLPQDIQRVFTSLSGEKLSRELGQITDKGVLDDVEFMTAQGHTLVRVNNEERNRWGERAQVVINDWLKECQDKGIAVAPKVLESVRAFEAEIAPTVKYPFQ